LCDYYEAQDAVQLVFIKLHNNLSKVEQSKLKAWLFKVSYNTCIDILRKKRFSLLLSKADNAIEPIYIAEKNNDKLYAALATISAKDRALVFSRAIDNAEYSELEKIYGVSAAALRKRYERAKTKLANKLREYEQPEQNFERSNYNEQ